MPELSDVVGFFSRGIRTADGRVVRGLVQAPKREPRAYDGSFVPRLLLKTVPGVSVPYGTLLLDRDGQRFITAPFTEDTFFDTQVKRTYVLFQINADMVWTRPSQTVEPISGLAKAGPVTQMGTIPCLVESSGVKSDVLKVDVQTYKVLTIYPVEIGDYLDGRIVKQVTHNLGITNVRTT